MSTSAETRAAQAGRSDDPPARSDPPTDSATGPTRLRRAALAAGIVAVLAALAFPFAPVERPVVTYRWPTGPAPTAAAIPMLPYQPLTTTVSVTGDAARATRGVLVSTLPLAPEPGTEPLSGLSITSDGTAVTVTTGGRTLTPVRLPPGPSRVTVTATIPATTLTLQAGAQPTVIDRVDGDARPAVAGVFTTAARSDGLAFSAVGDTRFQTSIGAGKIAVGVVGLVALAVLAVCLVRLDRLTRRRTSRSSSPIGVLPSSLRLPPRWFAERAWRPTVPDAAITALLAVWTVIGPITVDDGYIAGIVRARGRDGQVGTVFRWLNSPETPFGWFYDVLHGVAELSPAPLWLRLPSSLLGLVAWFLLTRGLLPRLHRAPGRSTRWLAAVVFAAWWLPWNLSVRPEPWVTVGLLGVLCLLERALAARSVPALTGAAFLAGITLAVTPTGIIAFTPFLVAAVPLARLVRASTDRLLLAVAVVAALAATLLLVYLDQTWASVLDSVHIRTLIGGDLPWTDEYQRWATLLTPGTADGNLAKRAPVLLTLLGLLALATAVCRLGGPTRRVGLVTLFSLLALALTPTKWTHHFGAFAGCGTAVLVVAVQAWWTGRATGTDAVARLRRTTAATALVAVTTGLVLAGWNQWHWISNVDITWSTIPPQLGGIRFADAALVLGAVAVVALGAMLLRRTVAPGGPPAPVSRPHRIPPAVVVVVLVAVVALEVLSFARTSYARRNSYTLAADGLAALSGRSCGIADDLRVEPDPRAGLLPALPGAAGAPEPGGSGFAAVPDGPEAAGQALPGWRSAAGSPASLTTGWWALPADTHLLVVTVAGTTSASTGLRVEFGARTPDGVRTLAAGPLSPAPNSAGVTDAFAATAPAARDVRVDPGAVAPGAEAVRIVAADAGTGLAFSAPRVPHTEPWSALVPAGTPAALDWPVAYLFPCVRIGTLRDGATELPGWRVLGSVSDDTGAGYISYTASQGGPWTTTRLLVRQQRVPVYLTGLALSDVVGLERWTPVAPVVEPAVDAASSSEWGWWTPGPLSVGR